MHAADSPDTHPEPARGHKTSALPVGYQTANESLSSTSLRAAGQVGISAPLSDYSALFRGCASPGRTASASLQGAEIPLATGPPLRLKPSSYWLRPGCVQPSAGDIFVKGSACPEFNDLISRSAPVLKRLPSPFIVLPTVSVGL